MASTSLKLGILAIVMQFSAARKQKPRTLDPNDLISGTYEFEVMGRPQRLYVCDSDGPALYWSITDKTTNEYTVAVGRDSDGVEYDGKNQYVARCAMFKLYGNQILEGYYEIVLDKDNMAYTLRERFPQLEDGEADTMAWNEYDLTNVSPATVGNSKLMGYQCFTPLENMPLYQMPLPSLWKSEYETLDVGNYYYYFDRDALTQCWSLTNEFGNVLKAGYHYGYDFKWDGALLTRRFDSVNNPHGCKTGVEFMVQVEKGIAIVSYQCDDRVNGRTYMAHLQDKSDKLDKMSCPFEVTPFKDKKRKKIGGKK